MEKTMKKKDSAVSPVVGVLLMLVVVIIIAAVVSGFAGSMAVGQEKAPSMTMDMKIMNSGEWRNSAIQMIITGVSEPIPTKDIQIITEWINSEGIKGGSKVSKSLDFPNTVYDTKYSYHSPGGYGPGTQGDQTSYGGLPANQHFGNYTLVSGTAMRSNAGCTNCFSTSGHGYGVQETSYEYIGDEWNDGTSYDGVMAILGENWNELRPGDIVNVKILHIPSGKFIFSKDVMVE